MQILKPEYIRQDKRGLLIQIGTGLWRQVNYLNIKKGNSFGNHYHKNKKELFYVVSGIIEIRVETKHSAWFQKFKKNNCFLIEPYEKHTIFAVKDSQLVELLTHSYSKQDTYE